MTKERKTNLKFPCDFPIKIMGPAGNDFEIKVLTIVRKHVPDLGEAAISNRLSKDGTYQSITVTIYATSQQQLDSIYQELNNDKEVLMVL